MSDSYVIVGKKVYQIVDRRGVKHFRGNLKKCNCPYTDCNKIRFHHPDVAKLYSKYRFVKYGEQLRKYWSDDCDCYHLSTADYEVWSW